MSNVQTGTHALILGASVRHNFLITNINMTKYKPSEENLTSENSTKSIYQYCDSEGKPVFKTKEIYHKQVAAGTT